MALLAAAGPASADWTHLQPGPDALVVHVSAADGHDSNDGLSEATPKATIAAGFALLRAGHGDYLLLKRGETFTLAATLQWNKGGASAEDPMVFGAYGEGPRPIIDPGSFEAVHVTPGFQSAGTVRHLAIVGLHIKSIRRDFTQPGFDLASVIPGRLGIRTVGIQTTAPQIVDDLLIEDCKLEFLGQGIVLEGPYADSVRNVRLRRNVIVDTYVPNGDTNGVFVSYVRGLMMEENLIDGVQRAPGLRAEVVASSLSHAVYVQSTARDVTLRNNIFTRAFDGGMMRPGGRYEGNLVADVTIGSHHGHMFSASAPILTEGVDARVTGNAFLGVGANQGIQAGNLRAGLISGNLILSGASSGGTALTLIGETVLGQAGLHSLVIEDNFSLGLRGVYAYGASISNITIRDNQLRAGAGPIVDLLNFERGDYTFAGNAYRSETLAAQWFRTNQSTYYTLAGWTALVGESGAATAAPIDRVLAPDVGRYHGSMDGPPTLAAFLTEARHQSRQHWRDAYTAAPVIAYLREQLGVPMR
jgi:hypothetical protein